MKKLFILVSTTLLLCLHGQSQLIKKVGQKVLSKKEKPAEPPADQKEAPVKNEEPAKEKNIDPAPPATITKKDTTISAVEEFKSFQNYDFVPGDKVLFEDDWRDDEVGEFPSHWKLTNGEFLVNKFQGNNVLVAKERSDANGGSEGWEIIPRMKTEKYLPKEFTVEVNYSPQPQKPREGYNDKCSHSLFLRFYGTGNGVETFGEITMEFYGEGRVFTNGFANDFAKTPLLSGKPHLLTVVYKNKQLKVYSDGQRLFTVPDVGFEPTRVALAFATENSEVNLPMIVNHIRIAEGGNMNLVKKLTTDTKFIARGIVFDYNKATIKPESMGELNRIVSFMNEDKNIKFEIGGHTDGDGDDAYNLKLSQQRSESVKTQLIKMGIDGARLTTKGYGETKPIGDNKTPEGKANNRRVEFTKLK